MRVLIIGGKTELAGLLRRRLWREGHVVEVAPSGRIGLQRAESSGYDVVILGVMLADMDALALTRRLRSDGFDTPILMLAATATVDDRLQGLDAGADDFLTAPFSFEEVLARLRALARRGDRPMLEDRMSIADLVLDRRTRIVTRGTRRLSLAPREFALLEYLMRHAGQVMSRAALLEQVWGYDFESRANAVDAAIKRLRQAVDAGDVHPLIETVRGVGYRIQNDT
jgi:DNA-binding response OmpR family regulator